MNMAFTGKVNTNNILQTVNILAKDYTPFNLPICVDFDQVFDITSPARCISRNNIDNPSENLFYVTKPIQAVINQVKTKLVADGKYFSLLPCQSTQIEDTMHYANNLVVSAFIVSDTEEIHALCKTVKAIYDSLQTTYCVHVCEDAPHCVSFFINGICVCRVEAVDVLEKKVTVASIMSEPMFSKVVSIAA